MYIWPLFAAATVGWFGCKKLYNPKLVTNSNSYLVVEGFINTGNDSTIVKLSRTVQVSSSKSSTPEPDAVVSIDGDNNTSFPLTGQGGGEYAAPALGLDTTHRYRLHIHTTDGNEYVSDYSQPKYTPPIDSVGYTVQGNGIQLYVNAHDPKNNTRYYRWDYDETWQFHAEHFSTYITNGTDIVARAPSQFTYECFHSDTSSSITLASSAKLAQDVIYQSPLIFIPSTSEKIEVKYSILVKQYALTSEAFNYWENLEKNSQNLGTIFDPQPSELTGNIHCVTNPAIPVIGYLSVGNVQEKRIFINNRQLPQTWQPTYPYACHLDTLLYCAPPNCYNQVANSLIPLPPQAIPVIPVLAGGQIIGYFGSSYECTDCTIRGTKTQPAFWQ